jgi:hypothetical protein
MQRALPRLKQRQVTFVNSVIVLTTGLFSRSSTSSPPSPHALSKRVTYFNVSIILKELFATGPLNLLCGARKI